MTKGCLSF